MAGHSSIRYNGHPAWERLDPDVWPREWLDGPRAHAKQLQMLEADMAHALCWVEIMQQLVDEGLPDEEFTLRRLTALKDWEKSRHREQKALHYRYDPLKRRRDLIERDVDKAIARTKERLAELRIKLEARKVAVQAAAAAAHPEPVELTGQEPARAPRAAPRTTSTARPSAPAMHPGLAELDKGLRTMYDNLAPIDIATTPDDELRRIWAQRNPNMSAELIETVIAEINGE